MLLHQWGTTAAERSSLVSSKNKPKENGKIKSRESPIAPLPLEPVCDFQVSVVFAVKLLCLEGKLNEVFSQLSVLVNRWSKWSSSFKVGRIIYFTTLEGSHSQGLNIGRQHMAPNHTDICLAIKINTSFFQKLLSLENRGQKLLKKKDLQTAA